MRLNIRYSFPTFLQVLSHRFEFLTVLIMKTTVFWEVMLKFMVIAEEPAVFIFVAEKM